MSNEWPPSNTRPTDDSFYFCDGEYGPEIHRVSPEGNVLGQTRWVGEVQHKLWWTGSAYKYVDVTALHMSIDELPLGRPFGEVRKVREWNKDLGAYEWPEYWFDSSVSRWNKMDWLWTVEHLSDLRYPGVDVGCAHVVLERCVPFVWTGFQWERYRHTMLEDDEPQRHIPDGFMRTMQPDARVEYYSPSEIGVEPIKGGSGKILVNLEYVTAQRSCSVTPSQPVLNFINGEVASTYINPSQEYWIYLANQDLSYVVAALPGDLSHGSTEAWDFRGKLFLSTTTDVNGYLSNVGSGLNARLVGKIETDNTAHSDGGPYFIQELDISLISRQVSLPETYREFSDFTLVYQDPNTLKLEKIGGTYGQIFAGGNLHYFGEGAVVTTTSPRIVWSDSTPRLTRVTSQIAASTRYFVYLAGEMDPFNFNAVNPDTNRPWQATDDGAVNHYQAALDLRLELFLSETEPDNATLSEAWPGYYARHVGQVTTDSLCNFVTRWDLSAIRQPTLNPSWFDGLAEIELTPVSTSELRVCKKKGSSGIVSVRGTAVQTYDYDASNVHKIAVTDPVKIYTESNQSAPLGNGSAISAHPGNTLYLYLANGRSLWGNLAGRTFVSATAPTGGYLSQNWPGNNARWLCSLKPNSSGLFAGAFITATVAVSSHSQLFDDEPEKHRLIDDFSTTITNLKSAVGVLYEVQKRTGLPIRLEWYNATHVRVVPTGNVAASIVLPDMTLLTVNTAGWYLTVTGSVNTTYYVYISPSGLTMSTTPPDAVYDNLQTLGTDKVLVGWVCKASDGYVYTQGVWSFSHEQNLEFTTPITADLVTLSLPGCIVPPGKKCRLSRTGQSNVAVLAWYTNQAQRDASSDVVVSVGTVVSEKSGALTVVATATLSDDYVWPGVYSSFWISHTYSIILGAYYVVISNSGLRHAGNLILTRRL